MSAPLRTIVLWCPDWPVTAAQQANALGRDAPLALIAKGLVFACSAGARAGGGAPRAHPPRGAVPLHRPGGAPLRPGARQPRIRTGDLWNRAGCSPACSSFGREPARSGRAARAATTAARSRRRRRSSVASANSAWPACVWASPTVRSRPSRPPAPRGHAASATRRDPAPACTSCRRASSPRFLAPLPVGILVDDPLATLLSRLGVHTLGQFAALPADDVRRRFGAAGAQAHDRAAGVERAGVSPRVPPRLFDVGIDFEPPLDRIDQVTFAIRGTADAFIDGLTRARLVCTAIRVDVRSESGEGSERSWLHPRWFTAADVVDRVRWQLQGSRGDRRRAARAESSVCGWPRNGSTRPGHHEQGLWGSGPDERIHHGLTRVQGMLGHEGVLTAVIGGGRMLADRQLSCPGVTGRPGTARPWAERRRNRGRAASRALPPRRCSGSGAAWPWSTAGGDLIDVDDRGRLTGTPALFSPTGEPGDGRPAGLVRPVAGRPNAGGIRHAPGSCTGSRSSTWMATPGCSSWRTRHWWAEARYD